LAAAVGAFAFPWRETAMMDCPPRRRENARTVRDMIRGLKESAVSAATGSKWALSSARGAWEHKVRWGFRGIGGTSWNRSGNEAESQRERCSLPQNDIGREDSKLLGLPITRLRTSAPSSATVNAMQKRASRRQHRIGTAHAVLALRRWREDVNGAFTMSRHGFPPCRRAAPARLHAGIHSCCISPPQSRYPAFGKRRSTVP
jgi:hypothetical protein